MKIEQYILNEIEAGNYEIESCEKIVCADNYYLQINEHRFVVVVFGVGSSQVGIECVDYDNLMELDDISKEIEGGNYLTFGTEFRMIKTDSNISSKIGVLLTEAKNNKPENDERKAMRVLVENMAGALIRAKTTNAESRFSYLAGSLEMLIVRAENYLND